MEEEDSKQCPNCKREIPSVNFTTHSVHCARNLRNCPVCKEPVPVAQLQEHHDALHKEVPCKKCGESVCGTDLEDHIRDSCAQTIKPCRYCELELPRHALPAHETYCGARSEQCAECGEYVMLKYRQLHQDSNHGFIRLSDDPVPIEVKAKPKPTTNGFANPSTSQNVPRELRAPRPTTEIRYYPGSSNTSTVNGVNVDRNGASSGGSRNEERVSSVGIDNRERGKAPMKRTNEPQINTSVEPREKVHKELPSRGAVKKRLAPAPPAPAPDPRRDLPYWSAQKRALDDERRRKEQSALNLAQGLPPVLSPAEKLDKLRKMDALHNREVQEDYSHKLRGRVWQPVEPEGQRLGSGEPRVGSNGPRAGPGEPRVGSDGQRMDDLSHLQPMTTQQFMDRFQELQLGANRRANGALSTGAPGAPAASPRAGGDRFSEIKSSLRELRRGLNEVTAPYNTASNNSNNTNVDRLSPPSPPAGADDADELRLPCEFCGVPILADDLVLHQTGCRPDLTQYRPRRARPRSPRPPRPRTPADLDDPVIPCEFCTESLPVYLISEHQERCRRDPNVLYAD